MPLRSLWHVTTTDNGLAAERLRCRLNYVRSRLDTHLVRPCPEEVSHIVYRRDAPAHGEGHEALLRELLDQGKVWPPAFRGGRDVQEQDLVHFPQLKYVDGLQRMAHGAPGVEAYAFDERLAVPQ